MSVAGPPRGQRQEPVSAHAAASASTTSSSSAFTGSSTCSPGGSAHSLPSRAPAGSGAEPAVTAGPRPWGKLGGPAVREEDTGELGPVLPPWDQTAQSCLGNGVVGQGNHSLLGSLLYAAQLSSWGHRCTDSSKDDLRGILSLSLQSGKGTTGVGGGRKEPSVS